MLQVNLNESSFTKIKGVYIPKRFALLVRKCIMYLFLLTITGLQLNAQYSNKHIVIVFDNSASMNIKNNTTGALEQCDAANFALQVFYSTLNNTDNIDIVLATIKGETKILSNPSLDEIKTVGCSNATMIQSFEKGIEILDRKIDVDKDLIIISDGEWWSDGEQFDTKAKEQITRQLQELRNQNTGITFINTAENNDPANIFFNEVSRDLESRGTLKNRLTNKDSGLLFDEIVKQTKTNLNIRDNVTLLTEISGKKISFDVSLPLEQAYVLIQTEDQKNNLTLDNISTLKGQIISNSKAEISRGPLKGTILKLTRNEQVIDGPDKVQLFFNESIPDNANISLFVRSALDPFSIVSGHGSGDNLYREFCSNENSVKIIFPPIMLKDQSKAKDETQLSTEIYLNTPDGRSLARVPYNKDSGQFETDLDISSLRFDGIISLPVVIKNGDHFYNDKGRLQLRKKSCTDLKIVSKEFAFTRNLKSTDPFLEELGIPQIIDLNTGKELPGEVYGLKVPFETEGMADEYSYDFDPQYKEFTLLSEAKASSNILCNCLAQPSTKELKVKFRHDNAKEPGMFVIRINEVNDPFLQRCLWPLIYLLILLLFLLYLWKILSKEKFKSRTSRKPIIERESDKDNDYLRPTLLNKINPFSKNEKCKTKYGFVFKAASNDNIQILTISNKNHQQAKTIRIDADGLRSLQKYDPDSIENYTIYNGGKIIFYDNFNDIIETYIYYSQK